MKNLIKKHGYKLILGILAIILIVQLKNFPKAPSANFPETESATVSSETDKITIYITKEGVNPKNIRIKRGGQLTFYQADSSLHKMNSGPHPTHTEYPPLNIGSLKQDESKTVIMRDLGVYGFHDHINDSDPIFQGQIEVYE